MSLYGQAGTLLHVKRLITLVWSLSVLFVEMALKCSRWSISVCLGKAAWTQTLQLLPQRLNNFGLAMLRLAPQVLFQLFPVQRPQRVAGAHRCARQTLRVKGILIWEDSRTAASCQPVLLLVILVLWANLHIVIIVFSVVLKVSQIVLSGTEDAQGGCAVEDHYLLSVM